MLEDLLPATAPTACDAQDKPAQGKLAVRTTCPYCGVGCGVIASYDGKSRVEVSGDPRHPANFGRLCSKGSALGETLGLGGRLLHPMMRSAEGGFSRISWDEALDGAAQGFRDIIEQRGPDAVAFYLSGQLLTEDYYVANKLMKGFIGSSNVDTNSRLCMASAVAGHKRAFGVDAVPGCYEDLDEADLLVLVGSNAAWCHPVLFQRMMRNREKRGARIVVIDTRVTATAESADLFLQVRPGSDQAFFSGLLCHLFETGATDRAFISLHTTGFEEALAAAQRLAPSIGATAALTSLSESAVAAFFALFAKTARTVTAFSQGVNQSSQGTDKVNAIINCHLATGRVGKTGASPFSLTGQPNAMGGREVGGLANTLAAHMGFDEASVDRVRRFWDAPAIARREGLKAVDMFKAVAEGKIKALWVVGTNPAVSLPDAETARAAMRRLELFVVSDNVVSTDTIASGAHLLLPALAWGEKSGTVTNSERRISRQRAFLPSPGEARADWAIFSDFAKRMGFNGFSFSSAAEVFQEHAALSAFENEGVRAFDIGGLYPNSEEDFDAIEPTQWPITAGASNGKERLFAAGRFTHADGRAAFVAPAPPALSENPSEEYPLSLNTGRIRDQWHSMTRTGVSPRLARHLPEPFVEINPEDAASAGISDRGFARVSTARGACILRAVVTDRQPKGRIFVPIHWSDETASNARISSLVAPNVDPHSGQPELKATPAAITAHSFKSEGFVLSREPMALPAEFWWARVAIPGGVAYRVASAAPATDWRRLLPPDGDVVEFCDDANGVFRAALIAGDRPTTMLAASGSAPVWDAALDLFSRDRLADSERLGLLSERALETSGGELVCACFGVGEKAIEAAIDGGCRSVAAIGGKLRAGTNCGSCLPEIARLIAKRG